MTRLDHNRGLAQLKEKSGAALEQVKKVIIWGNHSATQYPDLHHATVGGKPALSLVDSSWFKDSFIPRCSSAAPPSSRRAALHPPLPRRRRHWITCTIGCSARRRAIG